MMKHFKIEVGAKALVDVQVFLHAKTDRAAKLEALEFQTGAHWFPLSQIELSGLSEAENTYLMTCPKWLATEKGFC
jgi:hypothetical protein